MLNLVFNNFTTNKKHGPRFFRGIIQKAIKQLGFEGKNLELSVNLVGRGKIKSLNKKYLGKNKATDVLSFPLGEEVSAKTARNGIIALGDIFICLPEARRGASREGLGLNSKLALLTVHGLLHLLGHHHEKSRKGAEKMFKLQEKILKHLAFSV